MAGLALAGRITAVKGITPLNQLVFPTNVNGRWRESKFSGRQLGVIKKQFMLQGLQFPQAPKYVCLQMHTIAKTDHMLFSAQEVVKQIPFDKKPKGRLYWKEREQR